MRGRHESGVRLCTLSGLAGHAVVAGADPAAAGTAGTAAVGAPQSGDRRRGDDGVGRAVKAALGGTAAAVFVSVKCVLWVVAADTGGVDFSLPVERIGDGAGGWRWGQGRTFADHRHRVARLTRGSGGAGWPSRRWSHTGLSRYRGRSGAAGSCRRPDGGGRSWCRTGLSPPLRCQGTKGKIFARGGGGKKARRYCIDTQPEVWTEAATAIQACEDPFWFVARLSVLLRRPASVLRLPGATGATAQEINPPHPLHGKCRQVGAHGFGRVVPTLVAVAS